MTADRPSLAELTETYRAAKGGYEEAREALAAGVRAEHAAGMRQADIVRAIDHEWTGEYVRKLIKKPPAESLTNVSQNDSRGADKRP